MDERAALADLADRRPDAGDDCAVVDGQVITTDMLHERTDFPAGTSRYTAGWRAVAASLSDVAAMGAEATAAVAAYGAPSFDADELAAFVDGAQDVCHAVGAEYVGGDLDSHDEFTVASTAIGSAAEPVRRSGASPGDAVCVTGTLGRSAAALKLFDRGDTDRANELFQFEPRVRAGVALRPHATAMMDSSDGLARSLHQRPRPRLWLRYRSATADRPAGRHVRRDGAGAQRSRCARWEFERVPLREAAVLAA